MNDDENPVVRRPGEIEDYLLSAHGSCPRCGSKQRMNGIIVHHEGCTVVRVRTELDAQKAPPEDALP